MRSNEFKISDAYREGGILFHNSQVFLQPCHVAGRRSLQRLVKWFALLVDKVPNYLNKR